MINSLFLGGPPMNNFLMNNFLFVECPPTNDSLFVWGPSAYNSLFVESIGKYPTERASVQVNPASYRNKFAPWNYEGRKRGRQVNPVVSLVIPHDWTINMIPNKFVHVLRGRGNPVVSVPCNGGRVPCNGGRMNALFSSLTTSSSCIFVLFWKNVVRGSKIVGQVQGSR